MEIEHQEFGSRGAFFVRGESGVAAEMTYSKAGDGIIVIDHTAVSEALGGQGVGKQLLNAAVAYVREHGIQIVPVCPFARSLLIGDDQYADVLAESAH